MNYKPRLIARVPTQNPSDLEDPVILTATPREGDVFRWTENPVKNPSFRVQIKLVLNHEI